MRGSVKSAAAIVRRRRDQRRRVERRRHADHVEPGADRRAEAGQRILEGERMSGLGAGEFKPGQIGQRVGLGAREFVADDLDRQPPRQAERGEHHRRRWRAAHW